MVRDPLFGDQVHIADLSPARRDSVQRCRDVQELVALAEERNLYRHYASTERNLIMFHAYCTGKMTYEQMSHVSKLGISTISSIMSRIIYQTLAHEGDIVMNNAKERSILV